MLQRGKHAVDDSEKASLLQASPENGELKLQMNDELVEREAVSAAISARRAFACQVVAVGFGVLFLILFCFKALTESPDQRRNFSAACVGGPLGGGPVGPRGTLLHFDPRCTEELKEYFDQAYYAEVRRVSDEAVAYFRQQVARQEATAPLAPASSRGTVIFDIDETALSNMDGFFGPSSWSRLLGVGSGARAGDRCVRPHLEYAHLEPLRLQLIGDTGRLAPVQPTRRPLCYAPPLRATLDLYNYLYDNNFTVVFLTGRSEDARAETEDNLADAGYGRKCGATKPDPAASTAFGVGGGAAQLRRQALQYGNDDNAAAADASLSSTSSVYASVTPLSSGGVSAATETTITPTPTLSGSSLPFAGLFSPPAAPPQRCYAELLMREVGDERLASVFKAEARVRLVAGVGAAGGHVLVGNIGDQFSDLVGTAAAVANFKLPNPVYTLL